jgi:MoxR-like ATPase
VRPAEVGALTRRILSELEGAIVGKRAVLELVVLGLLADGHVLIDDYPGLAKTLIARSLAQVLGLRFTRIQFTPDLMPADITGSVVFNQRAGEFELRRGPVFTDLLLGDEVNRAPPKTQAALLEAMGERQVTIDGVTHQLGRPFLVLATQNPIEYEGTYPLPEAQLDRFLLRTSIGYPGEEAERAMVARRLERGSDEVRLARLADTDVVVAMQEAVEQVHVDPGIISYVVALINATRSSPRLEVGASPRGSLAVVKLARARAALGGRDYVVPDDVKAVAVPALAHRLILRTELWVRRVRSEDVMAEILADVPAPTAEDSALAAGGADHGRMG